MRAPGLRGFLFLVVAAVAVVPATILVAFGLPALARGRLNPVAFVALVVAAAAIGAVVGAVLLARTVARPIERLLSAAAALGAEAPPSPSELPLLGDERGLALARAAVAFERLVSQLGGERIRVARQVQELTLANTALASARESLVRSEKLATVGRLAAGLAHEVGNPLGAITGYVDVARSRVPPDASPDLRDALDRIAAAAARVDRTVRDLLDFARPAATAVTPIELDPVLDASLRLARVQPRFRDVEVELELEPRLPRVLADEHHLAQVVLNLLLNAADATGGGGHVRIAARARADAVELQVADDGRGIAAHDLPRIFDPFFTTKEPGEGTGLGLAISHRIVESFGGRIDAANRPEGGAAFTVTLRAAPGEERE